MEPGVGRADTIDGEVTRDALIRAEDSDRVIVALGNGNFQAREVMTGIESGEWIQLIAGLKAGDEVVTSGLGGAFPSGYPVAVVDKVTRLPQEPFAEVTATPAAALDQVREVMLIYTSNRDDGAADE